MQLSARVDSTSAFPQINFLVVSSPWTYAGFAKGCQLFRGGAGRVTCHEVACDAWRSQAFVRGFGGMLPRENILELCNLVSFRAYFHKNFT